MAARAQKIQRTGSRPPRQGNPASTVTHQHRRAQIQLTMLTWYLRMNLQKLVPGVFAEGTEVQPHSEQGVSNFTFFAKTSSGEPVVIRMKQKPADAKLMRHWSDYHKEAWVSQKLAGHVPVPALIKEGIGYIQSGDSRHEYAFIIQQYLPWHSASGIEEPGRRQKIFEQLGAIARKIHNTNTTGFGTRLLKDGPHFEFGSWDSFLSSELEQCSLKNLQDREVISSNTAGEIETVFRDLSSMRVAPTLYHTDFTNNWGNVLIDSQDNVQAIIDWEFAAAGYAAPSEFAVTRYVFFRNGQPLAEWEADFLAFLQGYGLSPSAYHDKYESQVEQLMLIHATKKLVRYEEMKTAGLLTRHWQIQFAVRAQALVQSLARKLGT